MNLAQKTFLAFAAGALTLAWATAGHASDSGDDYGHPSPPDSVQLR